jgi:hypothetical protein
MKTAGFAALVALFAFGGAAHAAPPHSVTYSQISVAPGAIVNLAGKQFVAVQVPMRQFTVDKRYAVRFLSQLENTGAGNFVTAYLTTSHSTDPLLNPNAMIDTFPARIEVTDGRQYSIATGVDPQTFETTNRLQVTGTAIATVQIKVGDTLAVIVVNLTQTDQDTVLGPNEYRGTGVATYGKYTDPVALLSQASGLDRWVDYIRIIPLN